MKEDVCAQITLNVMLDLRKLIAMSLKSWVHLSFKMICHLSIVI